MNDGNEPRPALIAAAQSSEATTELLRFHCEGPAGYTAFGDVEVVEKLAEALALACGIDAAIRLEENRQSQDADYLEAIGQLQSAAEKFIQDWCG